MLVVVEVVVITASPERLVVLVVGVLAVRIATQFIQIPALQILAAVAVVEEVVFPVLDLAIMAALV
jgi:hypothetical protein